MRPYQRPFCFAFYSFLQQGLPAVEQDDNGGREEKSLVEVTNTRCIKTPLNKQTSHKAFPTALRTV